MDRARRSSFARPGAMGLGFLLALATVPVSAIDQFFKVSEFGAGVQIWFEAENFDQRCPGPTPADEPDFHPNFPVEEVEGAFEDGEFLGEFGRAIHRAGGSGSMLRYSFDLAAAGGQGGEWYFWGRVVNPGNRSDYLLVEGDPGDAIPPGDCEAGGFPGGNGATFPGGSFLDADDRIFETNTGSTGPPPVWGWAQDNHEEGHTKQLRDGLNSMFTFRRESGDGSTYWDVFMWTNDPDYIPTDENYLAADFIDVLPPQCDPPDPDTHCLGLAVEPPPGNVSGVYRVTVDAADDGGEPIRYLLSASNGVDAPKELVQVNDNIFDLVLGPGSWTISVTVDDDPLCDDAAPDNACSQGPIDVVAKPDSDYRVSHVGGGTQIWIQAENFDARYDQNGPDPDPPVEPHAAFPLVAAEGALGDPEGNAIGRGAENGMLVYHFDISEAGGFPGTWYHFGRVINAGGFSDYMLVDSHPRDSDIPGGPPFPGGEGFPFDNPDDRVFEGSVGSPGPPPVWGYSGGQEGHSKVLQAGQNSMYFFRGEAGSDALWDLFVWADSATYQPRDEDYFLAEVVDRPSCTGEGDTHCRSFTVDGPAGGEEGIYTVTVDAADDSGDSIVYTLTADDGTNPVRRVIQTGDNLLQVFLTPGRWSLGVEVDDDRFCDDTVPDAACSDLQVVDVTPARKEGDFKVSEFGGLGAVQIWFEAEDFTERFDDFGPDLDPPIEPHPYFPVVDRFGAFFKAVGRSGESGGMLRYEFDLDATQGGVGGPWYFWARAINPGNRSDYMLVRGDPGDPVIPDGPPFPGGHSATFPDPEGGPDSGFDDADDRIFEDDIVGDLPGGWAWAVQSHEEGHTKELQNGVNEMFIFPRESGNGTTFWDVFMWTNDSAYVPTDDDYRAATPMSRTGERCGNGLDDDDDGLTDCDDPDCANQSSCQFVFRRGDSDASGVVDISDPIFNLTFQFVGGIDNLPCEDAADVDDSGVIDISDPIYNLTFQFVGGITPPPAPGPTDCGPDSTQSPLSCESYPAQRC